MTLRNQHRQTSAKSEQRPLARNRIPWGETPIAESCSRAHSFSSGYWRGLSGAFFGIPIGAVPDSGGRLGRRGVDAPDWNRSSPFGRLLAIALVASLGGGLYSLYIGPDQLDLLCADRRASFLGKRKRNTAAARMTGSRSEHPLFTSCCRIACHRPHPAQPHFATDLGRVSH